MAQIIASPANLFELARQRKPAVVIALPHAYEAVQSLRKIGGRYQFLKSAPSIAGKIALLSLEGGVETAEDLELFATLSPVCGMKDGRIINTTGHTLPFNDDEEDAEAPKTPASYDVDDYIVQRVDNEWYYYEYADSAIQSAVIRYIHNLVTLNATLQSELSK
jgi:hypothetical protein|nr:MAG TPA: hypothetical protein [Caudoviricetes sp.]